MTETKTKECTIIKGVVLDSWIRAEMPLTYADLRTYDKVAKEWRDATPAEIGAVLREKCREFMDFLRDHSSQDIINLEVVSDIADVCSCCGRKWEADYDDGWNKTICAGCGAILKTEGER